MKHLNFKHTLLLTTLFAIFFAGCKKDNVELIPETEAPKQEIGKYENGFFLIHEGWFGHGTGSVSFYDYSTGEIADSVFQKENPGKDFNPTNSTVQYATIFEENLYIVSKVNGPVVVANAKTLKEVGRIPAKAGNDWRAFLGIDENTGLLSSSDGIHLVNLKSMTPYARLSGISGQTGDMLKTDKYIFALSQKDGAVIYNRADYSVAKQIKGVTIGFAQTPNKKIWYTANKYLISLDPESLKADSVQLPFTSNTTWFTWYSSPIIASTKENDIYIQKAPAFGGGKEIYKYVEGDISSLSKPFITTPEKQSFYKKNIGYDGRLNQIVTTTVQDGYGANYAVNKLYFYDAKTGELIKQMPFNKKVDSEGNDVSYYFTAMPVFHQGN